jgi:hypothetical protein
VFSARPVLYSSRSVVAVVGVAVFVVAHFFAQELPPTETYLHHRLFHSSSSGARTPVRLCCWMTPCLLSAQRHDTSSHRPRPHLVTALLRYFRAPREPFVSTAHVLDLRNPPFKTPYDCRVCACTDISEPPDQTPGCVLRFGDLYKHTQVSLPRLNASIRIWTIYCTSATRFRAVYVALHVVSASVRCRSLIKLTDRCFHTHTHTHTTEWGCDVAHATPVFIFLSSGPPPQRTSNLFQHAASSLSPFPAHLAPSRRLGSFSHTALQSHHCHLSTARQPPRPTRSHLGGGSAAASDKVRSWWLQHDAYFSL